MPDGSSPYYTPSPVALGMGPGPAEPKSPAFGGYGRGLGVPSFAAYAASRRKKKTPLTALQRLLAQLPKPDQYGELLSD